MPNTEEIDAGTFTDWLRFRCPPELKKAVQHLAVDEGTTEQGVCVRLLSDAVEREESARRKKPGRS